MYRESSSYKCRGCGRRNRYPADEIPDPCMCGYKETDELPVSNCCGVDMPDWPDSDICPECKEHCGIEEEE